MSKKLSMARSIACTTPIAALALCSLLWLGSLAPAQAATVTDTFPFKSTNKEFCEGDPKFFEKYNTQFKPGKTLTITRDVLGTGDVTDIQATFNPSWNADVDAIIMNGLALPSKKSGRKAKLVLSGVNPGNTDHFITLLGNATFDKLGNLTKVTGTFVLQITNTYTLPGGGASAPVECLNSGTFGTGKKILVP